MIDDSYPINQFERAYAAWRILINVASVRGSITYGELGSAIGIHHRVVSHVLSVIQDHCLSEKLPPLTILIVNKTTKNPGVGFIAWDIDDISAGFAAVYAYNWAALSNPFAFASDGTTLKAIVQRLIEQPNMAKDIYSKVKNRGIAQRVFRDLMLEIYDRRCAFCDLSYVEALEAAHIIPWSKATLEERLISKNGLLLCATHHRLFDTGRLTLSPTFQINVTNASDKKQRIALSESDQAATIVLHGKLARTPISLDHKPCPKLIERRNTLHVTVKNDQIMHKTNNSDTIQNELTNEQ